MPNEGGTVEPHEHWNFDKGELPCEHFWRDKTVDCCVLPKGHIGDHRGEEHQWSSRSGRGGDNG